MLSEPEIIERKKELRRELKEKISVVPNRELISKSPEIIANLASILKGWEAQAIALYKKIGFEPDIFPVVDLLPEPKICLPVLLQKNTPMIFREYKPGDVLEPGSLYNKVLQPSPAKPEIIPDIVILPLLGFDETGARLGRGGGYYDRTLAHLRVHKTILAIGIGLGIQKIPQIPKGRHDEKMDFIVTESNIYKF